MSQSSIHFGPQPRAGKPRLLLSFSGGRTSGYMTRMCLTRLADQYEMIVLFANTGQENEATLEFVRDCDEQFGFKTVWLECVIEPEHGAGTTHRVVDFATAHRGGDRFEEMIRKYGIPNQSYPHCTRELKLNPMRSYLLSIGWDDYTTAIGVRPDEARRVNVDQMKLENGGQDVKIVYPLIDWFYADKQDVNDWWEEQPFNLRLREHEGNCKWCWKKGDPKHFLLIKERPEIYDFPAQMEARYPRLGPEFLKRPESPDRVFFRRNRSTEALFAEAAAVADQPVIVLEKFIQMDQDKNSGCGESCEMYPMLDFGEQA